MPGVAPVPADIYKASRDVFLFGDAHGDSPRPIGVAKVDDVLGIGQALGRTTQRPRSSDMALESPSDSACGLSKTGWWTSRHQQPVLLKHYGTAKCQYAGSLAPAQAIEFLDFYKKMKMVGL